MTIPLIMLAVVYLALCALSSRVRRKRDLAAAGEREREWLTRSERAIQDDAALAEMNRLAKDMPEDQRKRLVAAELAYVATKTDRAAAWKQVLANLRRIHARLERAKQEGESWKSS